MKQRFLMALAMSAIVGGCTTPAREDGAYVSLLRDAMVEAARVAEGSGDSAGAVRAVEAWRTRDDGQRGAGVAEPR